MSLAPWLAALSPAAALCGFTVGILLIYAELNRPGRVVPGVFGLLLVLLACARLAAERPWILALLFLAMAAGLLAVELMQGTPSAVSVVATLALVLSFHALVIPAIGWTACILCSVALGGVTTLLTRVARRAKANKTRRQSGQ